MLSLNGKTSLSHCFSISISHSQCVCQSVTLCFVFLSCVINFSINSSFLYFNRACWWNGNDNCFVSVKWQPPSFPDTREEEENNGSSGRCPPLLSFLFLFLAFNLRKPIHLDGEYVWSSVLSEVENAYLCGFECRMKDGLWDCDHWMQELGWSEAGISLPGRFHSALWSVALQPLPLPLLLLLLPQILIQRSVFLGIKNILEWHCQIYFHI